MGNNVQLAHLLGFKIEGQSTENDLVWYGKPTKTNKKVLLRDVAKNLQDKLKRLPLVIGNEDQEIKKIAWCTGGAQNYIQMAANLGADLYISGEISEQTTHASRELGIAYISAGHHATESYGVQALGQHLAKELSIRHIHVDVPNPA